MKSDSLSSSDFQKASVLQWVNEMAPYGVLTTDEKFRIQGWNHWLETHSGQSESDLIGRELFTVFPDLVERGLDKRFHQALQGEINVLSSSFHKYLFPFPSSVRDSGEEKMLQTVQIAPLHSGDRLCGTITLVEDVSQREHQARVLRRQFHRQELLSSASESLLLAKNPAQVVREFMPLLGKYLKTAAYGIYLCRNGEWTILTSGGKDSAKDWIDSLPEGFLTACTKSVRNRDLPILLEASERDRALSALDGKGFFCRGLLVADNLLGTLILVPGEKAHQFAAEDLDLIESVSHYLAVALDRERAMQDLLDAHQDLETKVHERTSRLEESVQQLESFSYSVAHDLRAPIRAIKGYGEVLLEDFAKDLPKQARSFIARIRIAAVKMELLTKDLLDYCQVSREVVEAVPVDLEEIISEISLVLPAIQTPRILTIEKPLESVLGHPAMVRQAMTNLIENAVKFKSPERPLKITVNTTRSAPDRVRISVQDNGIGIDADHLEKVFGMFERLHGDSEYEGSGIGLAIVARSIQRMSGSYGVESTSGAGSRFWIELPATHRRTANPKP